MNNEKLSEADFKKIIALLINAEKVAMEMHAFLTSKHLSVTEVVAVILRLNEHIQEKQPAIYQELESFLGKVSK